MLEFKYYGYTDIIDCSVSDLSCLTNEEIMVVGEGVGK